MERGSQNKGEGGWQQNIEVEKRDSLFVPHDPVVVLAAGVTTATRMLPVLSDTTVSGGNVSPLLPILSKACGGEVQRSGVR